MPDSVVRDICLGLLDNDSLTFHDDRSAENFKDTCLAYLQKQIEILPRSSRVLHGEGSTFVWSNPISVDPAELAVLDAIGRG